jgi:alkane 1-monooxygenase
LLFFPFFSKIRLPLFNYEIKRSILENMKKIKYFALFILPVTVYISFNISGIFTFLTVIVFFVLIPVLEFFLPASGRNKSEKELLKATNDPFYSNLLYFQVLVQWGFVLYFLVLAKDFTFNSDSLGKTLSMGIMCGVVGINLGHELGHRSKKWERFLGELLLLSSLENHFLPYHNRGHHADVATPKDPATARTGELLYFFWIRSHFGSYFAAWKIEAQRLKIVKKRLFSFQNKMVVYSVAQISLLVTIYLLFGFTSMYFFIAASAIGIALLETVNYIEHYGLLRKKREDGSYERVRRAHSWNSNHPLGRVILFELSRHSDHHYKPDKHYQVLESHDESPQMPTGYPAMMVLAFFPPLFFLVMRNHKLKNRNLFDV